MYAQFYNLKKEPFHITPDPEFLFLSPSHKQALGSIIYGIQKRKGFIVIIGEVGVGKTTILHSYLDKVGKRRRKTIYIFHANISFKELLKTIHQQLGLDPETEDVFEMVNHLSWVLIKQYKRRNTVVLMIDEAQNLPVETLESLRMLSNLESSKDKLIQIVLAGQPELEQKLNLKELRQFKQRIAIRSTIFPLTEEESMAYVEHRLAKAAIKKDTSPFTKGALKKIIKHARGIPRTINILCDNALISGFGYQKKRVNSKIVKEVIADFTGKRKSVLFQWRVAALAVLLLIVVLFLISPYKNLVLSKLGPEVFQTAPLNPIKNEADPLMRNRDFSEIPQNPIIEEIKPFLEKEISEPYKKSLPETRIVREGNNLWGLTKDVYGSTNNEVIKWVKQNNPQIEDVDLIQVGDEIVFPEFEQGERK